MSPARDVADWCERSLQDAKRYGFFDTRCFVQNVDLIIEALRQMALKIAQRRYCEFCDKEHQLHEDAQGFHHVIKGERIACQS